jgi:hypothetical protein
MELLDLTRPKRSRFRKLASGSFLTHGDTFASGRDSSYLDSRHLPERGALSLECMPGSRVDDA